MKKDMISSVRDNIQNISPDPKWMFTGKNIFWWGLFLITTFLGALAFSVLLFLLLNADWQYYHLINHSSIAYFFSVFPYFWLLSFIVFLILAFVYTKQTKNAYKYSYISIVMFSIVLSAIFGGVLYATKIAHVTDDYLRMNFHSYGTMVPHMQEMWGNSKEGRLIGEIIQIGNNKIILEDFQGQKWNIDFSNAQISGGVTLEQNEWVRILGNGVKSDFKADNILPWMEHHPNMMRGNEMMKMHMMME